MGFYRTFVYILTKLAYWFRAITLKLSSRTESQIVMMTHVFWHDYVVAFITRFLKGWCATFIRVARA